MLASCAISGTERRWQWAKGKDWRRIRSACLIKFQISLYEKLTNFLADTYVRDAPINLHGCARAVLPEEEPMTAVFLFVCSFSVVFFGVFLFGCSRPPRKSRRAPIVRKISGTEVADSAMGRRLFVHLEQQMAEFLSVHHRSATLLLVGIALISVPIAAHGQRTQPPVPPASDTDQPISRSSLMPCKSESSSLRQN
jgi:hypothetical protein